MHRDEVRIAAPCHQDWGAMTGDARRRHCAACDKHVHDLSAMTEDDAWRLLRRSPAVCVRYTCRADGTVVHAERRGGRARIPRALLAVGAALASAPALAGTAVEGDRSPWALLRDRVFEWLAPAPAGPPVAPPVAPPVERVVMGEFAPPPPPPVDAPAAPPAAE
jgi:hypothetical protein